MSNRKQYDIPDMEIMILEDIDILTISELTNAGSGTGDCGGLPEETNLLDNQL